LQDALADSRAAGDAAQVVREGEKGLEVALHDAVEDGDLRRAPLVFLRVGQLATGEGVIRHEQERMRIVCLLRYAS
jgi:hypothetical protein